jgi:hypothetical protein
MEEATSTSESLDVQLGTSVRYNLALRLKISTKDRPHEQQQQQQHVPALRPKATATSKRAVVRAAARAALRLFGCFRNAAIEDSFVDASAPLPLPLPPPPPPPPPPPATMTTTAAHVDALFLPAPSTSWQSPVVVANVDALSAVFSEFASHDERPVITEQGIHDLLVRFGVEALCSKRELAALLRRQHPDGGGVPFEGFIQALRSLATTSLQHLPADDDEDDVRLAFLLHLMEPSLFDVGELNHTLKPHIDRRRIDAVVEKRPTSHIKTDDKFLLECQTGIGMTTDDTVSSP